MVATQMTVLSQDRSHNIFSWQTNDELAGMVQDELTLTTRSGRSLTSGYSFQAALQVGC